MRTRSRNGWVAANNNSYSLLKNSKVHADIEHMPMHRRIVYYRRNSQRVALQFALEDADTPLFIVQHKVELELRP